MSLSPVRRKSTISPVSWVRTIHPKWVRIVTVDIHRGICSRSIDTTRPCNIVDERNDDTQVSELFHETIHVVCIGERDVVHSLGVLIFRLEEDDRSAVRDLSLGQNRCDGLNVVFGCCLVVCVRRAQVALDSLKPPGEAPTMDLCIDVWTRALCRLSARLEWFSCGDIYSHQIDSCLLRCFEIRLPIKQTLGFERPWLWLVKHPC